MPKVSVIIPVYGVEKYIERCARSLFEQTLDAIEYLFIDDCTPDKSIEVLQTVLEDYPMRKSQVVIHRMDRNSGQAVVRTWGMKNATGDFIIHCDSDDWVELDAYQSMYDKAENDGSDIVVCDYSKTDGKRVYKIETGYSASDKNDFIRKLLLQSDPWSLCNKLFRRTACCKGGLVYPTGDMGEDMLLAFQLILNGDEVSYIPRPLYNYFYNPESITHTPSEEKQTRNFYHNKENVDLLINVFRHKDLEKKYADGIDYVKWRVKRLIWNMPFNRERNKMWRNTYKELNRRILFSRYVTLLEKVKFILTYLNLYPFRRVECKKD